MKYSRYITLNKPKANQMTNKELGSVLDDIIRKLRWLRREIEVAEANEEAAAENTNKNLQALDYEIERNYEHYRASLGI